MISHAVIISDGTTESSAKHPAGRASRSGRRSAPADPAGCRWTARCHCRAATAPNTLSTANPRARAGRRSARRVAEHRGLSPGPGVNDQTARHTGRQPTEVAAQTPAWPVYAVVAPDGRRSSTPSRGTVTAARLAPPGAQPLFPTGHTGRIRRGWRALGAVVATGRVWSIRDGRAVRDRRWAAPPSHSGDSGPAGSPRPPPTRRSPCACVRAPSTSSSARTTCWRPAPRCASWSPAARRCR